MIGKIGRSALSKVVGVYPLMMICPHYTWTGLMGAGQIAELVDLDFVGFFHPERIMSKTHVFVQFIEYFFPAGQISFVVQTRGI